MKRFIVVQACVVNGLYRSVHVSVGERLSSTCRSSAARRHCLPGSSAHWLWSSLHYCFRVWLLRHPRELHLALL